MNLSKYKLRTILLSGFGIVILLTIALLVFIVVQLNKLADLNENTFNHPLTVSNAVRDIEINILSINLVIRNEILTSKKELDEATVREIDSLEQNILSNFEIVKKQFLGNPMDVENALQSFLGWRTVRNEIMRYIKIGEWEKADKLSKDEGVPYVTMMLTQIDNMIEFATNKAKSYRENNRQIRYSINVLVIIFSLLLIIVTTLIALAITKSITNPINKIVKNIIRISKNSFGVDIDFEGNHHLILLENSVNKLEELSNKLVNEHDGRKKTQAELEESQKAMIYLLEDVNEIKGELEIVVKKLQLSNKELESFVYSVSHDLRAPLRSIMGFTQIISNRHIANLNEEGLKYFGFVLEASKNMADLIEDLLRFSRLAKNKVEKESVDLREVFEMVLQNLNQDILDKKAKIVLPENIPIIDTDRSLLGQILTNLIHNAILYHRKEINPEVSLSVLENEDSVILRIKDNGLGILKDHHEKIFNIFQRLHSNEEYPGTGIGLSVVQKAVNALGGTISLESQINTGTTFIVTLPKNK